MNKEIIFVTPTFMMECNNTQKRYTLYIHSCKQQQQEFVKDTQESPEWKHKINFEPSFEMFVTKEIKQKLINSTSSTPYYCKDVSLYELLQFYIETNEAYF